VASLHPMFAFSHRDGRTDGLDTATFAIEGDDESVQAWQNELEGLGHSVLHLEPGQKPFYHAAAVWASNFSLAVVAKSCEYLTTLGLTQQAAERAILPLLTANLANFRQHGLSGALTGPIERNDVQTVGEHLSAIPVADNELHCQLSRILLEQARLRHPGRNDKAIEKLLKKGETP
jgi:predicted short-subunit dehydrogenase-like oxidoreductase (DUF2520 family)